MFDPGGWHAFGPIKWTVITATAWLAAGAVLRRGMTVHRPSVTAWLVLLTWAAFTSTMALDPLSAWLGTPDRRFGMVTLATMAAAFVAGQGVIDAGARRVVARAAVVALIGLTVYGMAEAAGLAPVELTTTSPRLGSTFGSAAYLGAALCLLAPMSVGLAADRSETWGWRIMGRMAVVGGAFLLVGSSTRAALVGLGAAMVVTAPLGWVRRRPFLAAVSVAALAVAVVLAPGARRLVQPEVEARAAEWRTAISVLAAHPVTGTGLEGYRVAFPRHVDVDYVRGYGRTTVTDRAHSGPLDLGVALGPVGMVAWAVAAGWLTLGAWRAARSHDRVVTGMAAGVVALLTQELFLFPTLEVGVAGWAVAGMAVAARPTQGGGLEVRSRPWALLAFVISTAAAIAGMADVTADHLGAAARDSGDMTTADRAASFRADSFRYRLLAADLAARSGAPGVALSRVDDSLRLSPSDPPLLLARARLVAILVARGDWAPGRGADAIGGVVEQDPNHPELRLLHGDVLARAGSPGEAERAWLAASHLSPRDAAPDLRLTSLYLMLEERDLARGALERARKRQPGHPEIPALERQLGET